MAEDLTDAPITVVAAFEHWIGEGQEAPEQRQRFGGLLPADLRDDGTMLAGEIGDERLDLVPLDE